MKKRKTAYIKLRDKWIKKHKNLQKKLWEKHGDVLKDFANNSRGLVAGSLGSLMLVSSPILPAVVKPSPVVVNENISNTIDNRAFLISDLSKVLPEIVKPLSQNEENEALQILNRDFKLKILSKLEGISLERNYGYIGQEQHLAIYPGDSMMTHFDNSKDSIEFGIQGMAPGLGAWGYFADSFNQVSEKDRLREKYYIAAQTFLAPGFNDDVRRFITFFKYRKMIIINPQNGKAMVVVVGDAGPGSQTGKSFGGSPEVMKYLERVDGAQKGPVLVFFVDDPNNQVPLGPIEITN